jgi:hypothetical protein
VGMKQIDVGNNLSEDSVNFSLSGLTGGLTKSRSGCASLITFTRFAGFPPTVVLVAGTGFGNA